MAHPCLEWNICTFKCPKPSLFVSAGHNGFLRAQGEQMCIDHGLKMLAKGAIVRGSILEQQIGQTASACPRVIICSCLQRSPHVYMKSSSFCPRCGFIIRGFGSTAEASQRHMRWRLEEGFALQKELNDMYVFSELALCSFCGYYT